MPIVVVPVPDIAPPVQVKVPAAPTCTASGPAMLPEENVRLAR